jgi:hypothetical protein
VGQWPGTVTGACPILLQLPMRCEPRMVQGIGCPAPPPVFCKCCIQKTYIFCKLFRIIVLGTIANVLILNDLKLH